MMQKMYYLKHLLNTKFKEIFFCLKIKYKKSFLTIFLVYTKKRMWSIFKRGENFSIQIYFKKGYLVHFIFLILTPSNRIISNSRVCHSKRSILNKVHRKMSNSPYKNSILWNQHRNKYFILFHFYYNWINYVFWL